MYNNTSNEKTIINSIVKPIPFIILLVFTAITKNACEKPSDGNPATNDQDTISNITDDTIRFTADPVFEDQFNHEWEKRDEFWQVATWMQNGTQMTPKRCATNKEGHLVQTVLPGKPYRGGSVQSKREFGYGRWIARVRPSSVPGVLNSIFTKDWDNLDTEKQGDGTKFEVDIEFLTYTFRGDSGSVHLAIHRKDQKNLFTKDIKLRFNPSKSFHKWGFDILPDRVIWHVDGRILETWNCPEGEKIPADYEFFFNSWTKEEWIKGPPEDTAHYHIDYLIWKKRVESPNP